MLHLGRSLLLSLFVLAPLGAAQDANLSIELSGDAINGGTLSIDVNNALNDVVLFLAVSPDLGLTCYDLLLAQLCIGLAPDLLIVPIGDTDDDGNFSVDVHLPANPQGILSGPPLHFQAVTVRIEEGGLLPVVLTRVSNIVTIEFP